MSYVPRSGSVAERAIAHLRTIGGQIATRPLADEIDTDVDTLCMCLIPALNAGVVIKEKVDGLNRFRIGSGQPLVNSSSPDDDADPDDKPQPSKPPAAPGSVPSSVFGLAPQQTLPPAVEREVRKRMGRPPGSKTKRPAREVKASDKSRGLPYDPVTRTRVAAPPHASSPVEKPEVTPEPAELPHRRVRAGTAPFRCGVFSDGQLVLERGAQSMVLDRIEFESLVHFLERTLLEKAA